MDQNPKVIIWFKAFCILLSLISLMLFIGGTWVLSSGSAPDGNVAVGIFMTTSFLVMSLACLVPLFVKPAPWVWTYNLAIMILGLFGFVTALVCIPMMFFWFKGETRTFFGK